ncbi:glycoside hydrolase family 65 protein [Oleiagrimonas sp. C23AA]|uniref:glycoside hydrolase family 65 protein n=1 Tax=Oleiagrimonas sp. C23AA TaxID=2719047 RepID=UPI001422A11C|nr:glycoside hydrolase family 65 protein [Oleiagrimonas sp. C23AA]NII11901.1 glycoside hydrolase family 65 protein [Oleiagrimonas sp. C23AA]
MKRPALAFALLLLACAGANAANAPASSATAAAESFRFTAHASDLGHYFPSYLANGYFSTMTTPRGTGPARGYMVAFMDYTQGDIARPAAIPGWSEVDYNAGKGWLNQVKLNGRIFQHYAQTLDMHAAVLDTRYRFDYAGRATQVHVTSFVSQADHHIGVTRLTLTPQFTGDVQLRFPLRLWSEHQPRFPIATMSFAKMTDAVIASGQNLNDKPAPTPDRAPVWYAGFTRIVNDDGDANALSLWLNGQAQNGLSMAQAATVALPAGMKPLKASLHKGPYRLSLDLTVHVQKGHTYHFDKFVALSRKGWGGDAKADLALARQARTRGFDALLQAHRAAWAKLWQTDIIVDGDAKVQKALHSDLYYLLANSTTGTAWPMGACALTPNYAGHAFWDSDSWVFPALLLLHPDRAKPIVMFRHRTMGPAKALAKRYGYRGTMYPWEADPQTGSDQTPHFAWQMVREVHLDADVAIAQWQYYLATGDKHWLKTVGWPVIANVARFWASRVSEDKATGRYQILHVTSPDEDYNDVPNDTFTNAAARKALRIAVKAAAVVGATPDPQWSRIAKHLVIPFSKAEQRHYNFDPDTPHDKDTWMGATLAWLMYPNLDLAMSPTVRRNDFAAQLKAIHASPVPPNEMMTAMLTVGAAELGDARTAGHWLQANLKGYLKAPFNVRSETASNNAGYILATSAGFVQSVMYGLSGLRIEDGGIVQAYPPVLPPGWNGLTLRRIAIGGQRITIHIQRNAAGKVVLTRTPATGDTGNAH